MTNNKEIEQEVQKTSEKLTREMVENILYKNKNKSNNINNDIDLKLEMGETEIASFGNWMHVQCVHLVRERFIRENYNRFYKLKTTPYSLHEDYNYLKEATNLSQLWRQIKDRQLAIISACVGNDDSRKEELKKELRNNGYGFTVVEGSWVDEEIGERVYKESCVVVNTVSTAKGFEDFKAFMIGLCRKYNQQEVYIQNSGVRGYFKKNGTMTSSFSDNVIINDLKQLYYIRLKKS